MSLKPYRAKRNFKDTPEPQKGQKTGGSLRFTVQKHAARRLHYDVRLEYKGVLLSWAVPKGPSMDPHDKRLAIKVEDHPLDYQYFEGVIPKGNYGAGTVEIWDAGTYTTVYGGSVKEMEKYLKEGLEKGHFAVILTGAKLNGEFVFQKLHPKSDEPEWLMIKKEDSFAGKEAVSPSKSVKMPGSISPMLATLVKKPFDAEDWLFEIKWDGFRALAFVQPKEVQLKSRTDHLMNEKFPAIIQDLKKIKDQVILDGELVILDKEGKSSFQLMQNYQREGKGTLVYYVFDILFKEGQDLRERPLIERKQILEKYLKQLDLPLIRYNDHVLKKGEAFFKQATQNNLEGVIGKKLVSTYQSRRSHDWVKIKNIARQEVVIGGFTAPRGSRQKLGALLVGVYNDQKELEYVGHVGGGFDDELLQEAYDRLKPFIQKTCPFKHTPKANAEVTWVKPRLVCEVSFAEWTKDNMMRQPIFQGFREDKMPLAIRKEVPESPPKTHTLKAIQLTHLDKVYWPEEKYTKGQLIEYYKSVSSFILPYLKDRPIVLHRYPEGITGQDFYQKDIHFSPPKGIKTFPLEHAGKIDHYLLIDDLESLLFAINLGSIDLHPFISRCKKLENPDFCVIDLDPHGISFDHVIEIALETHHILEKLEIKHYCKTSGGKGLHILIPLHAQYDYEQSKQFATLIGLYINKKFPRITSLERNPEKRPKKIYLDCLQNRFGQTVVAPYSVRPRPHALVSTPLAWEEVNSHLDPAQFTMMTVPQRVEKIGDLLKPLLKERNQLKKALALVEKRLPS